MPVTNNVIFPNAGVLNELADVDGLLGLSFLSRFKIEMDAEQGYISLNQRK
jgi:hypothetical protein